MNKILVTLLGAIVLFHSSIAFGAASPDAAFPAPVQSYKDSGSVTEKLINRAFNEPLNLIVTLIFILAICHTFLTSRFLKIAHRYEKELQALARKSGGGDTERDRLLFRAQFFHFMGEVEAVFGIWLVPLFLAIALFKGWPAMVHYVGHVNVSEAVFVVVIMAMSSSLPILRLTENAIARFARLGGGTPAAWWLAILCIGPILGSFITEPAAMTISALLLRHRFYSLKPSEMLKYATLGLLFVDISVGGTLTHFAAPPIVMISQAWDWGLVHMAKEFGWKAVIGILLANLVYYLVFRRDLKALAGQRPAKDELIPEQRPIPGAITVIHLLFLAWTVVNAHYPVLVVLGFLFFLAFVEATRHNQQPIAIRPALLVGFFLAALVIHGGCQQWWIAPVLQSLSRWPLMIGATLLTAFNDNAAITYLASLVPGFSDSLKHAVVAGAVTGGGLTVIANAPNPAGQSILAARFGPGGVSPLKLFLAAIIPTLIVGSLLMLL